MESISWRVEEWNGKFRYIFIVFRVVWRKVTLFSLFSFPFFSSRFNWHPLCIWWKLYPLTHKGYKEIFLNIFDKFSKIVEREYEEASTENIVEVGGDDLDLRPFFTWCKKPRKEKTLPFYFLSVAFGILKWKHNFLSIWM